MRKKVAVTVATSKDPSYTRGDFANGARLALQAHSLACDINELETCAWASNFISISSMVPDDHKKEVLSYAEESLHFPVFLALLSGPIACRGDPERAAQLLGASDSLLKSMRLGLKLSDQPEIDRYEAAVRDQLGEGAFQSAWEKGQAMSLEQAVAYALG